MKIAFLLFAVSLLAPLSLAHAELRNDSRILWGGDHGDEKLAKGLYHVLRKVKGVEKDSDFEEGEKNLSLEGFQCAGHMLCSVRAKFGGMWSVARGSEVDELYEYLRKEGDLGKSFSIASILCTHNKVRAGAEYFCDIEFHEDR